MGRVIVNGGSHHLTSWETLLLENLFFFWSRDRGPGRMPSGGTFDFAVRGCDDLPAHERCREPPGLAGTLGEADSYIPHG